MYEKGYTVLVYCILLYVTRGGMFCSFKCLSYCLFICRKRLSRSLRLKKDTYNPQVNRFELFFTFSVDLLQNPITPLSPLDTASSDTPGICLNHRNHSIQRAMFVPLIFNKCSIYVNTDYFAPDFRGTAFLTRFWRHMGSEIGCFSILMIVLTLVTGSGFRDN